MLRTMLSIAADSGLREACRLRAGIAPRMPSACGKGEVPRRAPLVTAAASALR